MAQACPQCGSGQVLEEELYSVCEGCGFVLSEGILTSTLRDEQNSTAVPYYMSTEVIKKPCSNLISGLVRVRALCRILKLTPDMESGVTSLYEQAYNHAHFLHVRLAKKEILGGCCVLAICRQRNWPIAIATISTLLDADSAFIGVVYQDLSKVMNIHHPGTSINDLLESHCHGCNLSPGVVPDVCVESVERLVQRSAALLEVASDVWIVTGRHPLPILTACVFLAWQSLRPVARIKFTLNKFCAIAKLPKRASLKRGTEALRLLELREELCKLGRQLPWLRGDAVKPESVVTMVDDILEHRRALLLQAARSYESERGVSAEQSTPSSGEDLHWSEKLLFTPPSARNGKRRRGDADEPSVTGDEEISDSEIETYLRSPEEVTFYQSLQEEKKRRV